MISPKSLCELQHSPIRIDNLSNDPDGYRRHLGQSCQHRQCRQKMPPLGGGAGLLLPTADEL